MSTEREFDIVVIGVGMGGVAVAQKAARACKRVAVVDSRPYGGTCALRGCDPKKVLVGAAEVVDWHTRMRGHGVTGTVGVDWGELTAHKESIIGAIPERMEGMLGEMGVHAAHGPARFSGADSVAVGEEELTAESIVVAVGQKPRELTFPGAQLLATSTDFLELRELPERIVFVGGGYISMEFAHVGARAGSEVTVIQRGDRILRGFDADLAQELAGASREAGIDIRFENEVIEVTRSSRGSGDSDTGGSGSNGGYRVRTSGSDELTADLVVHGAGRVPEFDALDLGRGGIDFDPGAGIEVNEYLQSVSNPAVYAVGDSAHTTGAKLTPVGVHEGMIAASNILKGNRKTPDYAGTPRVTFTVPALSRAGMLESEARDAGYNVTVNRGDMAAWYTARRTNEKRGSYKIVIDEDSGTILGAHLLGGHAGEVINMFAMAIRAKMTAVDIKTGIFVHPAASSDIAYMV